MRGKSSEEKADEFLCFLESAKFNFYCERLRCDANLTEDAADCQTVKKEIFYRFLPIVGQKKR